MYKLKAGEDLRAGDIVYVEQGRAYRADASKPIAVTGIVEDDTKIDEPTEVMYFGAFTINFISLWEEHGRKLHEIKVRLEATWVKLYGRSGDSHAAP